MKKHTKHIITFLARLKRFTKEEGISSMLKVDCTNHSDNTVEDVFDVAETTGGIICEIDNAVGEMIDLLTAHYTKEHDVNGLMRLEKLKKL